ncbi:hypothetical protein ACVWW1_001088 [Bradyrhizobium sp. JR3.5]
MIPGETISPETSRTSVAGSAFSSRPTAATLPAAKATSVTASSFCDGSITRPPRRIKSKGIIISGFQSGTMVDFGVRLQDVQPTRA